MSDVDRERLQLFSLQLFGKLEGAMTSAMVHLGDRLGLYRCLADARAPLSSLELADAAGLHERWVREWLFNQCAAGLVDHEASDSVDRFSMSPEAVAVLASPDHPAFGVGMFHRLPQTMAAMDAMPESFRTGVGHDYDSHGPEAAVGIERSFEPWNRANLVDRVLPMMDGVTDRLERGATVIDVGCGAGGAALLLAEAFPASTVRGYDISEHALARAEERRAAAGLTNVEFLDPRLDPIPEDRSVDLVLTFDCLHDMTDPAAIVHRLRRAVADDGHWLLVDIRAADSLAGNIAANPVAPLLYGVSVLSCMSSALSEDGGAGLGTLGLPASLAEQMAREAGFGSFRILDVRHAINEFYEIRP